MVLVEVESLSAALDSLTGCGYLIVIVHVALLSLVDAFVAAAVPVGLVLVLELVPGRAVPGRAVHGPGLMLPVLVGCW